MLQGRNAKRLKKGSFGFLRRKKKSFAEAKDPLYGRGGETRTRDTRFWRPVLYQLSYAPKFLTTKPANKAGLV